MLKVRLQRVGRKNNPSFRMVVTDSKNGPKSGRFIEILGSYDARQGEPELKAERIKHWLNVGAQTSGTVNNLLIRQKVITGRKVNVLSRRSVVKTTEATEVSAKEPTPATVQAEVKNEKIETPEVVAQVPEPESEPEKETTDTKEEVVVAEEPKEDKISIDKEEPTT